MEFLSLIMSFAAAFITSVAAVVAVLGFARVVSREVPTVEFLVCHESDKYKYKLSVSNPTSRLLVLDYVEVLSPRAECIIITRADASVYVDTVLTYENLSSECKEKKLVFLEVPGGQTRCLEILFKNTDNLSVNFRIHWSKGLPFLDRCFSARKIKLNSKQIKNRELAAIK